MWPPCSIRTKSLTSVNKNYCRVCTAPGLISFSSGENCIVFLLSERPIIANRFQTNIQTILPENLLKIWQEFSEDS